MKAEGVHLLFWLLGTVGIAGTIALFVAVPAAMPAIVNALAKFFGLVLSYRIGCAALALVAGLLIADYWRAGKDAAEWKRRVAAFEQAQKDRDTRIATEVEAEVRKELATAATNNVAIDQDVREFHEALPAPPTTGNPFRVGDDACKLRRIAGQTECRYGKGALPVPKARPRATRAGDYTRYRLPRLILTGSS